VKCQQPTMRSRLGDDVLEHGYQANLVLPI
jgi:hypothetical protein